MTNNSSKYIFWVIPDLADKPQSYLIYKVNDRKKPLAHVVFENCEYQLSGDRDLKLVEQLEILEACENFLRERFLPQPE